MAPSINNNFATETAGVVDTSGKVAPGVNNTSGKLPAVSTTLAANLRGYH
jgi:hypothetical protein